MTEIEEQIQDLLIATVRMEKTQESTIELQKTTTSNVNKIVGHLEKLLPVHTEISNLKKLLYASIVVALAFGAWITIEYHRVDKELATLQATLKEKDIELKKNQKQNIEKINNNKNQITYLKGSKMNKPRG